MIEHQYIEIHKIYALVQISKRLKDERIELRLGKTYETKVRSQCLTFIKKYN